MSQLHRSSGKKSLADRFWEKVEKRKDDECWPWIGAKSLHGYGQIYVEGKNRRATQVSWSIHNAKPFPQGLHACHSCDNPNCVNPSHIWPGTRSENFLDAKAKGRLVIPRRSLATMPERLHCRRGHAFTADNTYLRATGEKVCRTCADTFKRAYQQRKAQEIMRGKAMKWLPIESAPKQGRFLAAYLTRNSKWICEACAWHEFAPAVTSSRKVFPATHWMPLPLPPPPEGQP